MSLKQPSKELEVTMVVSSRTLELMCCVMNLELDINSWPSILHNQMALLRGRIEHSLKEKTPYELLNGRKPNIAYFRVFSCQCYILKKGTRLGKFDKKCDE